MSSMRFRYIFRSFGVVRLWNVWYKNNLVNSVVKRWRERGVREVFQCFKLAIRPRRTFLISATAAFRNRDGDENSTFKCEQGITDDELEALLYELKNVQDLAKMTLYCTSCGKRLVIDKKHNGISYCMCKEPQFDESSDGWVPFMEAEDVIIWRKEYKPGQGLYAYKVYGRYPEVLARDFAAVQVDGAYRRAWDAAVAALAVVQRRVHDVPDQAVLHWEVLWPRLFANRDYVYIRRHKEFDTTDKESIKQSLPIYFETTSVHAKAKRKSMEAYARERDGNTLTNKVFVIVSRSCEHPDVPETKNAIRVLEYWSHMVVRTTDGADKPGMEFVLTYYDEPAVGGLPGGVAAWASGRAAPAYLARMRRAAAEYRAWTQANSQDLPDFTPFEPGQVSPDKEVVQLREQDMESSKLGPELDTVAKTDVSTQTENVPTDNVPTDNVTVETDNHKHAQTTHIEETPINNVQSEKEDVKEESREAERSDKEDGEHLKTEKVEEQSSEVDIKSEASKQADSKELKETAQSQEGDSDKPEEENNGGWWRYLYPFYYFV